MGDPFVRPGIPCRPDIERIVLKHDGTGTSATTAAQWATDQQRDTLNSIVMRRDLLMYTAAAAGTTPARLRHELLCKMADPLQLYQRATPQHPPHPQASGRLLGQVTAPGEKRPRNL